MRSIARLKLSLVILISILTMVASAQAPAPKPSSSAGLSTAEFSRLVREFSEDGGYFRSDNFISNETPYLTVIDKLRELGATGGAYLGVGPEQNFTYLAAVRPQIAFLFDIRRQAVIQQLMYKAIFHQAASPAEFLALLLSRPLAREKPLSAEASIDEMVAYFSQAPVDQKAYAANLAAIRQTITKDFQVPLNETDQASLEYVYQSFREDGLNISYRMAGGAYGYTPFPAFKEILTQTDLQGRQGNFLARRDSYDFVRDLHRRNLIVPVVGDFAGKKALASVGDYLRKNGLTVTAFYTSNVEQYLFQNQVFPAFVENVRKLPITEKSLFIRSASGRGPHPARLPGHRSATLLQSIAVFLKDFDAGAYQSYSDLVLTHYIAPEKP